MTADNRERDPLERYAWLNAGPGVYPYKALVRMCVEHLEYTQTLTYSPERQWLIERIVESLPNHDRPPLSMRPPAPSRHHRWYSICSAHQEYEPACNLCQGGTWLFEPHQRMSRQVYRFAPWLWRWWVNVPSKPWFSLTLAVGFTVGFTASYTTRARHG